MPAEWSPHQATWLSWPHNRETWPGVLEAAEHSMAAVVTALAPHETVIINVLDDAHGQHVAGCLGSRAADGKVQIKAVATDDAWIRDYGAIIVENDKASGGFLAVDFDYNAWGGKYPPYDRDRAVARQMAAALGLPRITSSMVFEGGSVDVNGEGMGLVTEQCLLNPNRNPLMTRGEIESCLQELLGVTELVWLGEGIAGDDTDGHVDNLARFVGPRCVVSVMAADSADPDYAALAENHRRLSAFSDEQGRGLDVIDLPMPDPVIHAGNRMPASYANFYIANNVVLMPSYGGPADDEARAILGDCFPGRQIVPIDCRPLIVGLGALHCLTQQIPVIVPPSEPEQ